MKLVPYKRALTPTAGRMEAEYGLVSKVRFSNLINLTLLLLAVMQVLDKL
jgi:hypothetical protein